MRGPRLCDYFIIVIILVQRALKETKGLDWFVRMGGLSNHAFALWNG